MYWCVQKRNNLKRRDQYLPNSMQFHWTHKKQLNQMTDDGNTENTQRQKWSALKHNFRCQRRNILHEKTSDESVQRKWSCEDRRRHILFHDSFPSHFSAIEFGWCEYLWSFVAWTHFSFRSFILCSFVVYDLPTFDLCRMLTHVRHHQEQLAVFGLRFIHAYKGKSEIAKVLLLLVNKFK